jgi:phenylacetate-CoA ligase
MKRMEVAMARSDTADDEAAFMFDRAAESMPRADLAALQLRRLKETVARAYTNVPHVRKKFDAAGATPDHLKTLDDIARFPFATKSDLRDNFPFGLFAVPREEVLRLHASSGTTGKPTVVGYTRGDLDLWANLMARSLACMGARPGDIFHNAFGYGLFTGGLGFHYGAERLGCTTVPASGGATERQVTLIRDFGANILGATPSYALNIAEVAQAMGIDLRKLALRCGAFGAEPWSEGMRREIEEKFGITAMDTYGLSEIIGPGVASECHRAQNGLHLWEDHFLCEVIDPDTTEPLPLGATGELVLTTLTKEALPMIRYRTRDITRIEEAPCPCGRTHRRMMRVTGRTDDMLIIRGVNVYPSQVEAHLLGIPGLAPHYQIVLSREGALDTMTVEVELASAAPPDELVLGRMATDLRNRLKSMLGVTCAVALKSPGEVPRSQGKAVRVIDLRRSGTP